MLRTARLSLAAISFACLAGCNSKEPQAPQPATTDTDTQTAAYTIGYSQCNRGEPWREQMDADIKSAAAVHDNITLVMKDAQNESLTQQGHCKEFVSSGVDLIIISPKDTSLSASVAEAYQAGIPVIILDRAVQGDRYTCFIGADNKIIGREVGKWVVDQLGGKGNVVELKGLMSSTPAQDRSIPFHEQLVGTQIQIVYEAEMEWLGDIAREKMMAALDRNPDAGSINLVYGANDPAAIQAYYAAKDRGRESQMLFVGVDALPHEGINAVREGLLDATFEYPNGAAVAIETAINILSGQEVPKQIILPTRLYTADNVDTGGQEVGG